MQRFLEFIFQSQGFDPTKKKRTERSLLRERANANSRREYEKMNYNFNHTTGYIKLSKIYQSRININLKRV